MRNESCNQYLMHLSKIMFLLGCFFSLISFHLLVMIPLMAIFYCVFLSLLSFLTIASVGTIWLSASVREYTLNFAEEVSNLLTATSDFLEKNSNIFLGLAFALFLFSILFSYFERKNPKIHRKIGVTILFLVLILIIAIYRMSGGAQ